MRKKTRERHGDGLAEYLQGLWAISSGICLLLTVAPVVRINPWFQVYGLASGLIASASVVTERMLKDQHQTQIDYLEQLLVDSQAIAAREQCQMSEALQQARTALEQSRVALSAYENLDIPSLEAELKRLKSFEVQASDRLKNDAAKIESFERHIDMMQTVIVQEFPDVFSGVKPNASS